MVDVIIGIQEELKKELMDKVRKLNELNVKRKESKEKEEIYKKKSNENKKRREQSDKNLKAGYKLVMSFLGEIGKLLLQAKGLYKKMRDELKRINAIEKQNKECFDEERSLFDQEVQLNREKEMIDNQISKVVSSTNLIFRNPQFNELIKQRMADSKESYSLKVEESGKILITQIRSVKITYDEISNL